MYRAPVATVSIYRINNNNKQQSSAMKIKIKIKWKIICNNSYKIREVKIYNNNTENY